ncbi:hypothetical protein [Candidatus Electronema sp. TJ]|uniref:hypothetical protein n=1 Tax=Candidatus Electronema sp. TJ TaxID=3401573 RepID=UPI003AA99F09
MIWNPEFRKNIQLEINPVKLVLMPMVLGMVFVSVYLSNTKEVAAQPMQITSLILFTLLVFVWGTKMVVESLVSEFNNRTWDSQRMTAISPWSLAWGKLFGSSLFAWYGGLYCLLVFAVTSLIVPTKDAQLMLKSLLIMIFAGCCIQTILFVSILTEFAKKRESDKMTDSSYSVLGILMLVKISMVEAAVYNAESVMHWHGIAILPIDMLLYSSLFFCLWGIVGMHRAMRKELQYENWPIAWTLFLPSLMIYCIGFIPPGFIHGAPLLFLFCWISFVIAISLFYLMLLVEAKHLVDLRLLITGIRQGAWSALAAKIPAWLISLLFAACICVLMLLLAGTADLSSIYNDYTFFIPQLPPLTLLCFCLRDLGIVLHVNFSSTKKNRDMVALFYLAILYLLLPLLLSIAGAEALLPWFIPMPKAGLLNSALPVAVQAGFALHLAAKRLRQKSKQVDIIPQ